MIVLCFIFVEECVIGCYQITRLLPEILVRQFVLGRELSQCFCRFGNFGLLGSVQKYCVPLLPLSLDVSDLSCEKFPRLQVFLRLLDSLRSLLASK